MALNRAGVPVGTLQELDGSINRLAGFPFETDDDGDDLDDPLPEHLDAFARRQLVDTGESELLGTADVELTENATRVWLAAQRQQDSGHTWGEAVAFTERVAARLESVTLTQSEVTE